MRTKAEEQKSYRVIGLVLSIVPLALLLAMLLDVSPVMGMVLYGIVYLALCIWRPQLALLLLYSTAMMTPDLSEGAAGIKMSISELSIAVAFPVCVLAGVTRMRPMRLGPMLVPSVVYLGIGLVASWLNWRHSALISIFQMCEYLIAAVIIFASWVRDPHDYRRIFEATVLTGTLFAIMAMAGHYHFPNINKNNWGGSLAGLLLIAIELWISGARTNTRTPYGLCVGIIALALLGSFSRGGWLGALGGLIVLFGLRRQFKKMFQVLVLVVPVVAFAWINIVTPAEKSYATNFSSSAWNIRARWETIDQAKAMYQQSPVIGLGLGIRKDMDATNVILITAAETGVLGVLAFLWIHLAVWRTALKAMKQLPRSDPLYSICILSLALLTARFVHGCVDHYWSRGALMQAWAAVGMMLGVYYYVVPKKQAP